MDTVWAWFRAGDFAKLLPCLNGQHPWFAKVENGIKWLHAETVTWRLVDFRIWLPVMASDRSLGIDGKHHLFS